VGSAALPQAGALANRPNCHSELEAEHGADAQGWSISMKERKTVRQIEAFIVDRLQAIAPGQQQWR